jgi:hypothetical protein
MKRGTRLLAALAFTAMAGVAVATASGQEGSAPATSNGGRIACLDAATEGELAVELEGGENGSWKGELILSINDSGVDLDGGVYDLSKLNAKRPNPPRLRLKAKPINDAQRAELLRGLAAAMDKPEQQVDCHGAGTQRATVKWSCGRPSVEKGGSVSFDSDFCVPRPKGYARALGISDWAVALFRRLGAR